MCCWAPSACWKGAETVFDLPRSPTAEPPSYCELSIFPHCHRFHRYLPASLPHGLHNPVFLPGTHKSTHIQRHRYTHSHSSQSHSLSDFASGAVWFQINGCFMAELFSWIFSFKWSDKPVWASCWSHYPKVCLRINSFFLCVLCVWLRTSDNWSGDVVLLLLDLMELSGCLLFCISLHIRDPRDRVT